MRQYKPQSNRVICSSSCAFAAVYAAIVILVMPLITPLKGHFLGIYGLALTCFVFMVISLSLGRMAMNESASLRLYEVYISYSKKAMPIWAGPAFAAYLTALTFFLCFVRDTSWAAVFAATMGLSLCVQAAFVFYICQPRFWNSVLLSQITQAAVRQGRRGSVFHIQLENGDILRIRKDRRSIPFVQELVKMAQIQLQS